jgi:hypothetical protein
MNLFFFSLLLCLSRQRLFYNISFSLSDSNKSNFFLLFRFTDGWKRERERRPMTDCFSLSFFPVYEQSNEIVVFESNGQTSVNQLGKRKTSSKKN